MRTVANVGVGEIVVGMLLDAAISNVVPFYDDLSVGPIALDRRDLLESRRQHWGPSRQVVGAGAQPLEEMYRAVIDCVRGSLRVWLGPEVRAELALWYLAWECTEAPNWAQVADFSIVRVFHYGLARQELEAAAIAAGVCDREQVGDLRTHWLAYANSSPEPMSTLLDAPRNPEVVGVHRYYACLLPRAHETGLPRLRLSRYDQVLLEGFSDRFWMTPVEWLQEHPRRDDASELTICRSDHGILSRMASFSVGPHAAIDMRKRRGGNGEWTDREYRLTKHGRTLVDGGFLDALAIPGVYVGGYCAYRKPIWISASDGRITLAE